jgi:hypothetical protein
MSLFFCNEIIILKKLVHSFKLKRVEVRGYTNNSLHLSFFSFGEDRGSDQLYSTICSGLKQFTWGRYLHLHLRAQARTLIFMHATCSWTYKCSWVPYMHIQYHPWIHTVYVCVSLCLRWASTIVGKKNIMDMPFVSKGKEKGKLKEGRKRPSSLASSS